MSIQVKIPTPLRPLTQGRDEVRVAGRTVREVLASLEEECAGIRARLCDDRGELRRFVNLFLNEEEIRHLKGLDSEVKDGDVLAIVPAIAGGAAPTIRDLMNQIRKTVKEVVPSEVKSRRQRREPFVLLDVREKDEVEQGHLPGAVPIPRGFLEMRIEGLVPDRKTPIVAYCAGGNRSLLAAESLQRLGYENVASMSGGFNQWRNEGNEVVVPRTLSEADRRRYSRHLMIPEVGETGQLKLLAAKVLLVGAGGLGSPAAYYLAAAGVGTLGIVDFDVVDESNLQRQILHAVDRVGMPKTESARKTILGLNPGIKVNAIEARLSSANVEEIFRDYDLIVDGSDNFPTRYLVNDACVLLKKPNVHGSVYRFEGQVTIFKPPEGPCYRCLYPEPPPADLAPSCADAGVLGVLPGVIGLLEAVETVKLLLGAGDPLIGRLIHYDALKAEFRTLRLRRDPGCAYCGDGARFPGFIDYEAFCAAPAGAAR
ncbi:MAG TPA: molybdopterin-synthase adenylyltransferase MoeB [Candidatus Polarisedimenticolia bacterium]|jgi:molybdopterin/thiamine biosynthesis adenylyltransferase/molybdopterin converting factor small subunit|nr:molybdopterin-synthase adenylyltransferase MoeB [Candidatus Polarisedimenticolia bacterium]